ncbi:MAG: HEAT repeat domain-containing protein [Planctomycetota bacterium]|jgi:HEAT repeat protein
MPGVDTFPEAEAEASGAFRSDSGAIADGTFLDGSLSFEDWIIGLEVREGNGSIAGLVTGLNHVPTLPAEGSLNERAPLTAGVEEAKPKTRPVPPAPVETTSVGRAEPQPPPLSDLQRAEHAMRERRVDRIIKSQVAEARPRDAAFLTGAIKFDHWIVGLESDQGNDTIVELVNDLHQKGAMDQATLVSPSAMIRAQDKSARPEPKRAPQGGPTPAPEESAGRKKNEISPEELATYLDAFAEQHGELELVESNQDPGNAKSSTSTAEATSESSPLAAVAVIAIATLLGVWLSASREEAKTGFFGTKVDATTKVKRTANRLEPEAVVVRVQEREELSDLPYDTSKDRPPPAALTTAEVAELEQIRVLVHQGALSIPELVAKVAEAEGLVGSFARRALARVAPDHEYEVVREIQALILKSKSPRSQVQLVNALSVAGAEGIGTLRLIATDASESEDVRLTAIRAMSTSGSLEAIDHLGSLTAHSDPDVRKTATSGLARLGFLSGVPYVLEALEDENSTVQRAASLALSRLSGKPEALQSVQIRWWYMTGSRLEREIDELTTIVDTTESPLDIRWPAARRLASSRDRRAMIAMVDALNDPETEIRKLAAVTLADSGLGQAEAVPALIVALDDPDREVSRAAYRALSALTGKRLAPERDDWLEWWRDHL